MMKRVLMLLATGFLAGCGSSQNASLLLGDPTHSLSVIRQQAYYGSDWATDFVVSRYPDCVRRYPLKGVSAEKLKLDIYNVEPGVFIANAGKRWYVAETRQCRLEQYDTPPPFPGEVIGTFQIKDGQLTYVDRAKKPETPPGAAPAAGAAPR
jgi:hypothetical protein